MTIQPHRVDPAQTINELVEDHPRLMPILAGHGLDLCCGGPLTLREAAEHHGLDLDGLVAELTAALETVSPLAQM